MPEPSLVGSLASCGMVSNKHWVRVKCYALALAIFSFGRRNENGPLFFAWAVSPPSLTKALLGIIVSFETQRHFPYSLEESSHFALFLWNAPPILASNRPYFAAPKPFSNQMDSTDKLELNKERNDKPRIVPGVSGEVPSARSFAEN